MSEEQQTITIDDVDYVYENLPEQVKHAIVQIQFCRNKMQEAKLEEEKYDMMQIGYVQMLKDGMDAYKAEQ